MLFSEKLKKLRKDNNLTQEELADKINVSRQAITKWESGDGIPDIDNLKQISILFNVTIDELVKEDRDISINNIKNYSYTTEFEIDHNKHFDINITKINELNIISSSEDIVRVELFSNEEENIEELYKVKFDDLYYKLDIDIKSKKDIKDILVNIYLPSKYVNEIELKSKIKLLNIDGLNCEKLEYDGNLKYLNIKNSELKIVLNTTKSDVEIDYDKFSGTLEVNTINSISRVYLPKGTQYQTVQKGIKNQFVDANSIFDAVNIIELNGANSKLIIIEK